MVKPGYKMTEVGVIPEDWEVTQIGDLKPFVTSGSRGWATYYSDKGSPFIRITNLSRDCIYLDLEDMRFVNLASNDSEAARTQLRDGDVLISITADIGIIGYVSEIVPTPSYINQHIALVRFDPKQTSSKFVSYFLASEKPQKLFRALTDSGAKAGMNLKTIQQLRLALPPTQAEQEAIAEALSDADSLIASLQKLIAKKKAIKQGAMQELLTGKKRLPGFNGKWIARKIKEIARPVAEKNSACENLNVLTCSKHFGFVRSLEYFKNQVFSKDTSGYKLIYRGQIGYPANHIEEGAIGLQDLYDKALVSPIYIVFEVAPEQVDSFFLHRLLKLERYRQIFLVATCSSVNRRGSLRWPAFSEIEVSLPPLAEQRAITHVISDMDSEIEQLEKKLSKYQQIKQGMMQELLTGRIRLIDTVKVRTHEGDAAIMSGIAALFYSEDDPEKYPLGRKKVQKLMYITLRRERYDVSDFMKMAAGPYSPNVRYNSEPIAIERGYIITEEGDIGTKFIRGNNADEAKENMLSWVPQETIHWLLSNFRRIGVNDLELFATVDMAMCDLREAHKPVSVQSIKELIHSTEEWREKLEKSYFSDQDIQRAINKCREFFGEQ